MCVTWLTWSPTHGSRVARNGGSLAIVLFMQRGYWLKAARFHDAGDRSCKTGSLNSGTSENPSREGLRLALNPVRSNAVGYLHSMRKFADSDAAGWKMQTLRLSTASCVHVNKFCHSSGGTAAYTQPRCTNHHGHSGLQLEVSHLIASHTIMESVRKRPKSQFNSRTATHLAEHRLFP